MKHIPDNEWYRLFKSHEREAAEKERDEFLKALENGPPDVFRHDSGDIADEYPTGTGERRLPYRRPVRVDATLDLHLKRVDEARRLVASFLRTCRADGDRQVLIICGKGHHSEKGGVLRERVRSWLKDACSDQVKWFSRAPRPLGGDGAYVVRLYGKEDSGDVASI